MERERFKDRDYIEAIGNMIYSEVQKFITEDKPLLIGIANECYKKVCSYKESRIANNIIAASLLWSKETKLKEMSEENGDLKFAIIEITSRGTNFTFNKEKEVVVNGHSMQLTEEKIYIDFSVINERIIIKDFKIQ